MVERYGMGGADKATGNANEKPAETPAEAAPVAQA
jgi:hypothetical protein